MHENYGNLEMKIIDNFLTKSYHKNILELLSGSNFEWFYNDNVTGLAGWTAHSKPSHFNEYGFTHSFWRVESGQVNTSAAWFIQPLLFQILDVTDCDLIWRARADMVTWSKEEFIHLAHVDCPFPNIAAVFYVNESDGDTIFYNVKLDDVPKDKNLKDLKEYDRVSPKANRLVIFDGDLLHTGCSPTKHKNRIIINSNYIKNEYKDK
jgi:hypothetical protein